jgi:hypothetical protein
MPKGLSTQKAALLEALTASLGETGEVVGGWHVQRGRPGNLGGPCTSSRQGAGGNVGYGSRTEARSGNRRNSHRTLRLRALPRKRVESELRESD